MILNYSRWAAARGLARAVVPSSSTTTAVLAAKALCSTLASRGGPFVAGPEERPVAVAASESTTMGGGGSSSMPRASLFSAQGPPIRKVDGRSVLLSPVGKCRAFSTAKDDAPVEEAGEESVDPIASQKPPFTKILVANRGEIALRVMKTCRALGIQTVAVHSSVDARSPHVLAADEAVCVGPAPSSQSYLNVDAVLKAVKDTGAQAVHPGYGFLSENAEFAKRVRDMGAKFIGPSSEAIVAMGDKIQSKKLAREAGVNVIPGFDGVIGSPEEAVKIAEDVGFPVMIKATAGGGGKGMRICHTPEQVVEGYHLSTAEAKSFFSDDRLFIERYIENPHHIEIQVLAGRKRLKKPKTPPGLMNPYPITEGKEYGPLEILCFPERECSIQRRNQKIIEESPSVLLTPETRAAMVRQVKSLVRKVEYQSAGTVEFLVDEQQNFYFLEMNTRLQVEHPVTEMVSGGVDLVRGMIDVAGGRGVPEDYLALVGRGGGDDTAEGKEDKPTNDDEEGRVVPHTGHAIEARIYAEDPLRGFLPSIGPLLSYVEPPKCISHTPAYGPDDVDDTPAVIPDPPVAADGDEEDIERSYVPPGPYEPDDITLIDHTITDMPTPPKMAAGAVDIGSSGGSKSPVIRIDSGVTSGSQISQYYDPMISKLVAYSPTSREDAVSALRRALDRYVIRGVGHNAAFANDVLRHPDFIEGKTPTNFIERHYPEGFSGVTLTEHERKELAVIGAAMELERERSVTGDDGYGSRDASPEEVKEMIVCLGGMFGDAYKVRFPVGWGPMASPRKGWGSAGTVEKLPDPRKPDSGTDSQPKGVDEQRAATVVPVIVPAYDPISPVVELEVNRRPRSIQIGPYDESVPGGFSLVMFGADVPVLVMSPREYELSLKMVPPAQLDTSDYILSPMPGMLMSYAVEEGQHVEMGQEICVVEAMKMQNVIRAERAGVVKKMNAEVGGSLMADEVIVEFEKEGAGDEAAA